MAQQNIKPPPPPRSTELPAPELTKHGRCSDCNATAVVAGDGEYKVCPHCYAMLWHRDWSADERLRREVAAARLKAAQEAAVRRKEEQRETRRQINEIAAQQPPQKDEP